MSPIKIIGFRVFPWGLMKKLSARGLLLFSACAFPAMGWADLGLGGMFSIAGGFRWDHYKQEGSSPAHSTTHVRNKIKHIHLGTFAVNARATYDDAAYLRIVGRYASVVTRPYREVTIGAASSLSTIDNRDFSYDLGIAAGYTFDLFAGDFLIAPEFGYGYARLKIDENEHLGFGAPFAGFEVTWTPVQVWIVKLHFDYSFFGSRREKLTTPIAGITPGSIPLYLNQGRVQGPEGALYFGHTFNHHWSLGVQYRLKYLFTNERTIHGTSTTWTEKTSWTTNSLSLKLGYIF